MLRLARSLASSAGASGRGARRALGARSLCLSGPPEGVTPGLSRSFSGEAGHHEGGANDTAAAGSKEDQIAKKLREVVAATHVEVEDISGGCGSMYRVMVVSPEFEGLALVKQHRLVQKAIAGEIANMHGLTLKTMTEKKYKASST